LPSPDVPLKDAAAAHEFLDQRKHFGKVLLVCPLRRDPARKPAASCRWPTRAWPFTRAGVTAIRFCR